MLYVYVWVCVRVNVLYACNLTDKSTVELTDANDE